MNTKQIRAGVALKSALGKVRDAGLSLRVYDGHVYVVPGELMGSYTSHEHPVDICEEHGRNVTPPRLNADGGAGS